MANFLFSGSSLLLTGNTGFSAIQCGSDIYTGIQSAGYFSATGRFSPSPFTVNSTSRTTAYGSITKRIDNSGTVRPGDPLFLSANCKVEDRWREISPNYLKKMVELSGVYANIYVTVTASATGYNLQTSDLYPWGFTARLGQQTYSADLRFLSTAGNVPPLTIPNIGPYLIYNSQYDSNTAMLEIAITKPSSASVNSYASFDFDFGMSGIRYEV